MTDDQEQQPGPSRRAMIGTGAVASAIGIAGGFTAGRASAAEPTKGAGDSPFALRGTHQPGITTPVQDRLHFAAFDVTTTSRARLVSLLKEWTLAAERLMGGGPAGPIGPVEGDYRLPPDDTGEAIGLPASRLTLTFGFGPGLFVDDDGKDRFGLADRQPEVLKDLPHFPGDRLDPSRSRGDLCIQACADDPQVAVHAIRNLARIGFGTVSVRWSQLGFGRTSSTTAGQATPRNLFGFKDGTKNILAEETQALDEHVWVHPDDHGGDWLAGGSYLAARRINMVIETWDRQGLGEQEALIGRTKDSGAPMSGGKEHDDPDFSMPGRDGPIVPKDSHVAVVHPDHNDGVRILRRGYNFVDGSNDLGTLDAGLFFLAYVRDPATQFIPMQNAMAKHDAMMEYLKFTGSALFAIPPGAGEGEYIGQSLFT
ncbi:iron uptake transporter deferrochelatase/peroxidase subunit [Janibacter limosus]|uniref:iron uptake transporter deferrochelatase/peroxidase subunit n=1 Tax=Janibacter limosus TaxID=53458 RepID=UPI000A67BCC7|nr:iron uptake transporter deferrochelatase/peroxidase subunit [Janibacter limosus]